MLNLNVLQYYSSRFLRQCIQKRHGMRCDLKGQNAGVDDPKLLGPVHPRYSLSRQIKMRHMKCGPEDNTYCNLGSTTPPRSLGNIAVLPIQWLAPKLVFLTHSSHSASVPLGPIGGS